MQIDPGTAEIIGTCAMLFIAACGVSLQYGLSRGAQSAMKEQVTKIDDRQGDHQKDTADRFEGVWTTVNRHGERITRLEERTAKGHHA